MRYAKPADAELDALVQQTRKASHLKGGVEAVRSWMAANLAMRVSRRRVAASMARVVPAVDPLEQEVRDGQVYHNRGPWACIHSDGNHKVGRARGCGVGG
jgi:hypothetical protein